MVKPSVSDHVHPSPSAALRFFQNQAVPEGWATCPLTENAFLRILGQPGYPRSFGSSADARRVLQRLLAAPGHVFWPDSLSIADTRLFPSLPASKDLTDLYLLGLAVKHRGRFATFDRRLDSALVPGGADAYFVIPTP